MELSDVAAARTISEIALRHAGLRPTESGCGRETAPPATELSWKKKKKIVRLS